jgi:hypothetical protein
LVSIPGISLKAGQTAKQDGEVWYIEDAAGGRFEPSTMAMMLLLHGGRRNLREILRKIETGQAPFVPPPIGEDGPDSNEPPFLSEWVDRGIN